MNYARFSLHVTALGNSWGQKHPFGARLKILIALFVLLCLFAFWPQWIYLFSVALVTNFPTVIGIIPWPPCLSRHGSDLNYFIHFSIVCHHCFFIGHLWSLLTSDQSIFLAFHNKVKTSFTDESRTESWRMKQNAFFNYLLKMPFRGHGP